MTSSFIVAGARTPIGRFRGGLAPLRAVDLGGAAIRSALERAGIEPDHVEYTVMGHVLQAGQGQITARQAILCSTPSFHSQVIHAPSANCWPKDFNPIAHTKCTYSTACRQIPT